jgi:hypothetical protein
MMKQLLKHAKRALTILLPILVLSSLTLFIQSCGDDDELPAVTSSFTQTVDNTTGAVTFKNNSTNATSYLWNLGDGTTSTQFEPTKTYQTGTYTVKLTASNTAGGTASSENTFTVTLPVTIDTTKPIITLVGAATIDLTVGDPYVDKGATATDNLDGDITAKIVKAGTVNTAIPGTYTITYDVTDLAGNTAVRVSRSVIVTTFDDGLLENGAFSIVNGQPGAAWSGNAFNVINEGGSNFNFANVTAVGNAFDVNLSQVLPLVQGKNYILTFEASSGVARTMIAGIGLSVDPFTNDTKSVNLTTAKQTITLNVSAAGFGGANSRVIFDMGAALGTVVIDNVKLVEAPPPPCTAEATENINPANGDINWSFKTNTVVTPSNKFATTFDAFGNINSTIVTNPKIEGINTSCNVQRYTKTAACETWSGVGIELETAINWSTTTKKAFKMKVLAETQVTQVTLRLETLPFPNTNPAYDRVASITQVGEWQELTFDFSDVTTGTSKSMIIYFDRDQPCDGDVYYFDDIIQVAGAGGGGGGGTPGTEVAINGDFETGNKNGWTEFPNGGATFVVSDAEANGGTFSGKLMAGEAQDVIIKQANLLAGSITNGKSVTIKFDLKGSLTGAGGVVFAEFFSEKTGGGTSKAEILGGGAPLAPTSTWTTYTYTTTTASIAQGDVGGGITLQLKAACGAVAGCSVTAFFDNVSIKVNP